MDLNEDQWKAELVSTLVLKFGYWFDESVEHANFEYLGAKEWNQLPEDIAGLIFERDTVVYSMGREYIAYMPDGSEIIKGHPLYQASKDYFESVEGVEPLYLIDIRKLS